MWEVLRRRAHWAPAQDLPGVPPWETRKDAGKVACGPRGTCLAAVTVSSRQRRLWHIYRLVLAPCTGGRSRAASALGILA